MEDTLYFFLAGIASFAAKLFTIRQKEWIKFVSITMFPVILLILTHISLYKFIPDTIFFPPFAIGLFAFITAVLLYFSDKSGFISKPGIKYFATFFLGFVAFGIGYGISAVFYLIKSIPAESVQENHSRIMYFFLAGFLMVFGFIFPLRFFRKK
ncbi:hypothetical protein DRQ07_02800 [candidate division KSB1 bacterium]|nr:MAG: hypothetical protein DRQ07_02800 [candidate division KSB1 bacterium]